MKYLFTQDKVKGRYLGYVCFMLKLSRKHKTLKSVILYAAKIKEHLKHVFVRVQNYLIVNKFKKKIIY